MTKKATTVLAGDIGGTKTRLAVFSTLSGYRAPIAEASFPSIDFPGLENIVREFIIGAGIKADRAVFGVAGPVADGRARITNLPWRMDENHLADVLGLSSVILVNDLEALALAVPILKLEDIITLNKGCTAPGGAIAIVAPGTGLGQAYLTWDGTRYRAHPSEGGHSDFAPTSALETRLLLYLLDRFGHISIERVCSGIGIANIYRFLKEHERFHEPYWLAEQLSLVPDPVPVIVNAAFDKNRQCRLCRTTLNMFVSILGAEAGNLALKIMASGGVYLGGGIPPRILAVLQKGLFMKAFRQKGRMSGLMNEFPVHVIMNSRAALMGAASLCFFRNTRD